MFFTSHSHQEINIYDNIRKVASNEHILTRWGRDKMAAISNAFSWEKTYEFWLRFRWILFLRGELTIYQHYGFSWWLGADEATSHYLYLIQWRLQHLITSQHIFTGKSIKQVYIFMYIRKFFFKCVHLIHAFIVRLASLSWVWMKIYFIVIWGVITFPFSR